MFILKFKCRFHNFGHKLVHLYYFIKLYQSKFCDYIAFVSKFQANNYQFLFNISLYKLPLNLYHNVRYSYKVALGIMIIRAHSDLYFLRLI